MIDGSDLTGKGWAPAGPAGPAGSRHQAAVATNKSGANGPERLTRLSSEPRRWPVFAGFEPRPTVTAPPLLQALALRWAGVIGCLASRGATIKTKRT